MYDFDLFVIGGGSGGVRAARLAAQLGLRVAMAEGDRMGGTCVIRGCVPKKIMLFASDFNDIFKNAMSFGWSVGENSFDFPDFKRKLDEEIHRLEAVYESIMEKNHVRLFKAYAELEDAHHIILDNGLRLSAERILIATGSHAFIPEIDGKEWVSTSDDIFLLEELPKRMVIVGGSFIACEMAGVFNEFGTKVTQIYRGEKILRGVDGDIRERVSQVFRDRGIDLLESTDVERIENYDGIKRVFLTDGSSVDADFVLYATGRKANIDGLGLENAGVKVEKGLIKVNDFSQTSAENIYAIGDVASAVQLTPLAIRQAVNFVETVYKNNPKGAIHPHHIPAAIFSRPEIGTIGYSEEMALEYGLNIDVYETEFKTMSGVFGGAKNMMYMKIIVEKSTERLLGIHIMGSNAGELIQLAAVPLTMEATKTQLDEVIAVHPTIAEELVTMKTPRV